MVLFYHTIQCGKTRILLLLIVKMIYTVISLPINRSILRCGKILYGYFCNFYTVYHKYYDHQHKHSNIQQLPLKFCRSDATMQIPILQFNIPNATTNHTCKNLVANMVSSQTSLVSTCN